MIFFNEQFPTDGLLAGTAPVIDGSSALNGALWENVQSETPYPLTVLSGEAFPNSGTYGEASVSVAPAAGVGPVSVTIQFVLTPGAVDGYSVSIKPVLGGDTYIFDIYRLNDEWVTYDTPNDVSVVLPLTDNVPSLVAIHVEDGSNTITVGNVVVSNVSYFAEPTIGFSGLVVELDGCRISSLTVDDGFAVNGSYISSPSATAVAYSGGFSDVSAPYATVDAFTTEKASAFLVGPPFALVFNAGANAALTAPKHMLSARAHNSTGENAAAISAPRHTLSAYAGANAKLSAPSSKLAGYGTVPIIGRAALTAPSASVSASGAVSAMCTATLVAPSATLVGYGGAVCSITLTGKPTIQATGITGSVGRAHITAPLFDLQASGTQQNHGSAYLIAPAAHMGATAQAWLIAPGATLTAIGTAVVAVSYEAYAVTLPRGTDAQGNAAPAAVTHYTNYPFDYVVRYRNSYFGANANGLYLLEGTTDDGTAIPFAVQTHLSDFKTPNLKTVASAYLSGRIGAAETVSLTAGENNPVTHNFTTPRGAKAQNHRQKFGLGTKARYFSVGVSGNQQFELDAVELEVATMKRRI